MPRRELAYKKELLLLKGEMLRLRLRHELNQASSSLSLVDMAGRAMASGGKGRVLINVLTAVIPNKRLRTILRTTLRTVLVWQVARKYWLQR